MGGKMSAVAPRTNVRPQSDPTRSNLLLAARARAARQHGVISRDQCLALGIPARTLCRWVNDGTLVELHRCVYTFDSTPLLFPGRLRGALLAHPSAAIGAGETAAVLTDMAAPYEGPIHLLTTGVRAPRTQPGIVVRRTTQLSPEDTITVDGNVCTAPARTMIDLASRWSESRVLALLDRAMRTGRFDPYQVARVLSGPRLPGKARLRSAVAQLDETCGRNRSELERRLIDLIRQSHLPAALNNVMLAGEEVDVHFLGTNLVLEADGREWHTSPEQIAADIAKQRKLEAHGLVVARYGWHAVTRMPEHSIQRAERLLRKHAPELFLR